MREIKFRAWDGKNIHQIKMLDLEYISKSENDVLMQYTGLKDKNGNEIYEGDIVKYVPPQREILNFHMRKIEWIEHKSSFRGVKIARFFNDKKGNQLTNINPKTYEVIGNIYENPELLSASSSK